MDASSNQTMIFCPPFIDRYIKNLTSPYISKSNEASMVSASVIMFVVAGLFFNLNLFSGISDMSATLEPKVRLFLSSALSLLLPVMSYLFSEAKTKNGAGSRAAAAAAAELSSGAGLILAWMLLVELLRKKVDEIRMHGFAGTIHRAGRVVWLGSLVFFNISRAGRKALFAILWILCATRVVQRIAYTEIGKKSYAHGKNGRVINSYMAKKLDEQAATAGRRQGDDDDVVELVKNGSELLKSCSYIVMGEEKMVREPTADGYDVDLDTRAITTVGRVWELNETDDLFTTSPGEVERLKRLCLSFALFKLLRRKFERLPAVTDGEAEGCRSLILRGLLHSHSSSSDDGGNGIISAAAADELLQVMNDEVVFLSEYYHSVVPVVLASPSFLLVNYFAVLAVVAALCVMTVILCGNGDPGYAFRSIDDDNYIFRSGVGRVAICLIFKAKNSPEAFFSLVDVSVTLLLFVVYLYEEIWEFFVFLTSKWFMVSLVCSYIAKPRWWGCPWIRCAFHRIIWLRSKLNDGSLSFRQLSVLQLHHRWLLRLPFFSEFYLLLPTELVPKNLMQAIVERLFVHHLEEEEEEEEEHAQAQRTAGESASAALLDDLSRVGACQRHSVSELLLTWHIATCIMETKQRGHDDDEAARRTAAWLSKYCAYLVAFHPELLPDAPEKTERVVDDIKADLGLGLGGGIFRSRRAHAESIMRGAAATSNKVKNEVVRNGAELGRLLRDRVDDDDTWKLLADVWTELIVFVAPSADEERVKGHQDVLVQGGEFITMLWALTTHIGVSRRRANKSLATTLKGRMRRNIAADPEISITLE